MEIVGEDLATRENPRKHRVRVRIRSQGDRFPVRTYLNDDLHQIFLCNHVLAPDDLLKDSRQDAPHIHVQIDALELT